MVRIKGKALLDALENSVSLYPALEGRFPQVSNIEFEFDPRAQPRSRVQWAKVAGAPLDLDKDYVVVTRGYMVRGKDGFDSLRTPSEGGNAEEIVSEENGILISTLLRQYFMSLRILGQWKNWGKNMHRHWSGVHRELHDTHPVVEPQPRLNHANNVATQGSGLKERHSSTAEGDAGTQPRGPGMESPLDESDDSSHHPPHRRESSAAQERELQLMRKVMRKWWRLAKLHGHPNCCDSMEEGEFKVDWTRVSSNVHNIGCP